MHMSPRWGFGYLEMSPVYKHAAPLGLRCWVVHGFYKHVAPLGLKN